MGHGRAMDVMEHLLRDDAVRGTKELRNRLASDGARLARVVTSRVAGGLGGSGGVESQVSLEFLEFPK